MRCVKMTLLVALAAFLCLPTTVMAQEEPQAQKHEDVTWYEIVHVDYKAGKKDDALELIKEHYIPAEKEAGLPGPEMELVHTTGEWDATFIWHFEEGPSAFEWETSPDQVAFQKALRAYVGGEKKAEKISERYESYVADSKVILTRTISEQ